MSKNVAVYVDVANIFYAAKAAGVDIDYVTLLKSATAGRDFVRAYAYTGLDPENENQRNFHAFLARSGYKVVSKDIRKYGDGRVKANLDIELVVDMMRMAEKLDIAVVVSGDGDFAPAINAVQQKGVRVEVISFRGNTSSDLMDVADVFIDIAQVAKVEMGARSGRRVATDGDLSMTEVPDKESGVTPRRRRRRSDADDKPERSTRSRRSSRDAAPEEKPAEEAVAATGAGAPVALPGEKLSRSATEEVEVAAEGGEAVNGTQETQETEDGEDGGRRRRRRRGGRGRGRGSKSDEAPRSEEGSSATDAVAAEGASAPKDAPPEAAEFPDEVPTLPQHSGFGSVWDSQIGVPEGADDATSAPDVEEDLDGEPEVPEYLLSEKKQQGRRRGGRGRGGRQGGGYRSAIDRERYGSGSGYSRGSGSGRRSGQTSRTSSGTATAQSMQPIEQTLDGDPWSEVPADVQELLKAEMARRQDVATPADEAEAPAKPKKSTRKKSTAKTADAPKADADEAEAPAKPKRTTRKKSTAKTADAAKADADEAEAPVKPKRTTRKKSTAKTADAAKADADEAEAPAKPKRTTRKKSTAKTEEAAAEE